MEKQPEQEEKRVAGTATEEEPGQLSPPPKLIHSSSSSSSGTSSSSSSDSEDEPERDHLDGDESPLDSDPDNSSSETEDVTNKNKKEAKSPKLSPKRSSKSPKKPEEKKPYTLEVVVDRSDAKPGFFNYLAIGFWLGWFGFYFYFTLFLPILYWYFPKTLGLIIALILTSAIYPISRKKQPAWGWKFGAWLMKMAEGYFQMRVFCEDYEDLKASYPAIMTNEPHDVLPVGVFIFSDTLGYLGKGHKIRGCFTSACYSIPFMRHIYTWCDATDINKSTIKRLIEDGCTPTICPGGAHEVTYLTTPEAKTVTLYLKTRLGMMKIAAEYGVPIIPTFTFGQRKTWNFFVPQWTWLHALGRRVGFIPLVFMGIGNIPLAQPFPCPLTMVIAKPVKVPKLGPNATVEQLMPYHQQYLEAIERIFEKNKERFGMGDFTLNIV